MGYDQLSTADVAVREIAKGRSPVEVDIDRMIRGLEEAIEELESGEHHTECSKCGRKIWNWKAEKDFIGRTICEYCPKDVRETPGSEGDR